MTWHLHHGDCLAWLATLGDKSVDVTIADPPYEAKAHSFGLRVKTGANKVALAPLPFAAISEETRLAAAAEVARVTRRWALTFCQIEAVEKWAGAYAVAGHEYIRTCIWVKPDGQPQLTGDRPGMGYEALLVTHSKGRKHWNGGGRTGVFTFGKQDTEALGTRSGTSNVHPTQKPLALMLDLVSLFSDDGETVLDPFAGSGTTGVAALRLGRHFLGAELDAKYHAIAVERLTAEASGSTLQASRMKQISFMGEAK